MSDSTLPEVLRILHQEHKYEQIPPKAINKLLYLIDKKSSSYNTDLSIPYFWYMFGTVVRTDFGEFSGSITVGDNHAHSESDSGVRAIVADVLEHYYDSCLEEITDETYRDAPYSVQQNWRVLDKMLRTLHRDYNSFYEVEPSQGEIRSRVDTVYDSFPISSFPEHEDDILDWYCIMMRELNAPTRDVDRLMDANLAFWRVFSLSVAEQHRKGLSKDDVRSILGIKEFEDARDESRGVLESVENNALEDRFSDEDEATLLANAADSVAMSVVTNPLIPESG
mgnify:CR=1 FL=1